MKVTLERLPESRVQLDIEVDEERLEKSLHSAYRKVANKARIPGFRPGKAPRQVVERLYGREGLIREALDDLVPDAYNDAIKEHDVDAIDQPDLEIVTIDPPRFKATVPVRPEVALNDYKNIRVEKQEVTVDPEEVETQILNLRRQHATLAPVDRAAQWNDQVTAKIKGTLDAPKDDESESEEGEEPESEDGEEGESGEPQQLTYIDDDDATFMLREGQDLLVPGFAAALIGVKPSEETTFDVALPDDFSLERFRGAPVHFTVTITELKEEQLPEADDEFANTVNQEWETFAQLKENIETQLRERDQAMADNNLRTRAVDLLVAGATVDFPRILVEREIDSALREATRGDANAYRQYLRSVGRSEEEFRETFREGAEARVRRSLALGQLAEDEALEVTPEEVESEIETIFAAMTENDERLRSLFDSEAGRDTIRRDLLTRKTLSRLEEIVTSDIPPEPAAAPAIAETETTDTPPAPVETEAGTDSQEEEPA